MNNKDVENYGLYKKLSKSVLKIYADIHVESGKNDTSVNENININQKRIIELYKTYSKILRTLKQLDTIVNLLDVKISVYLSYDIKAQYTDYLEYNIENYYLRITSILDQAVILVSKFYNLGLQPQNTSLRMLRENEHTKDKEVIGLLREFDKVLQPLKKVRNLIAHRGEFTDSDITKIKANLEMLSLVEDKNYDVPEFKKMFDSIDKLIKKKIGEIRSGVNTGNKFIFALDHVLSCDEEFISKIKLSL